MVQISVSVFSALYYMGWPGDLHTQGRPVGVNWALCFWNASVETRASDSTSSSLSTNVSIPTVKRKNSHHASFTIIRSNVKSWRNNAQKKIRTRWYVHLVMSLLFMHTWEEFLLQFNFYLNIRLLIIISYTCRWNIIWYKLFLVISAVKEFPFLKL